MAYEVIKRVSGRAYRYRVESFRDPVTRRVRGRWTYLGRVDPADAGLPVRPPRPSSKDRLLDAVTRLLADRDAESLSAGTIAREAGVAYGTFYRYFADRSHAVREAILRRGPTLGEPATRFAIVPVDRMAERERVATWIRDVAAEALAHRGLVRAWYVFSNADDAVAKARSTAVEAAVDDLTRYLDALQAAGIGPAASSRFAGYALAAIVVALARDAAIEGTVGETTLDGLVGLAIDLCGLS
ncbi:MAG: TetR/AcrR family transcriptional regulator [Vulcanimicrobiaceae bacterium]|jgi:AcrR family transcriptional regulator